MQFNSILVLLFFMAMFVRTLHGQTCGCSFCSDSVLVSANSESQFFLKTPCQAGTAAAVSSLNVQSIDGSGFRVYTKDDPSGLYFYSNGSTTSTVTCFNKGSGFNIGGVKSQIYVIIRCTELDRSCSLRHSIGFTCMPIKTINTPKSTLSSTVKPVNPSTAATATASARPVAIPNWVGIFNMVHRCDTKTCCCPSGQATLSRANNNYLRVQCGFVGQCPSTAYLNTLIPMPDSFQTDIEFLGDPIQITLGQDSRTVELRNLRSPECSESARRNGALSTPNINFMLIALLSGFVSLKQFVM
ncbi:unnamed protein product [Adineta steineri]|uniref:Uncharacterized protein n=1 Tax=Adineta steineri TaxID=433720 RepID=A0A813Y247_9BILA|nr:unnamed protein product [Adineta steineri]CAF4082984.1 unnamed protein product [Adineta steineri]